MSTIFMVALMPLFMALIGLALDGGQLFVARSDLQAVADSAARAGASQIDDSLSAPLRASAGSPPRLQPDNAKKVARAYAIRQGVTPMAVIADDQHVVVDVARDVPMVFLPIIGRTAVSVAARGVARPRWGVRSAEP
jgi:uncharacterized membrane protein